MFMSFCPLSCLCPNVMSKSSCLCPNTMFMFLRSRGAGAGGQGANCRHLCPPPHKKKSFPRPCSGPLSCSCPSRPLSCSCPFRPLSCSCPSRPLSCSCPNAIWPCSGGSRGRRRRAPPIFIGVRGRGGDRPPKFGQNSDYNLGKARRKKIMCKISGKSTPLSPLTEESPYAHAGYFGQAKPIFFLFPPTYGSAI